MVADINFSVEQKVLKIDWRAQKTVKLKKLIQRNLIPANPA